jgi:hypothetical protein
VRLTLNQRVVGSSPTGGTSASSRQNTSKRVSSKWLRQTAHPCESRHDTSESDTTRPPRATHGATQLPSDDPDLAAIVAAWPDLPETIKAGIMGMVRSVLPIR